MSDQIYRFLFQNTPMRGEITQLSQVYQQVASKHNYPPSVRNFLGQLLAAASLLSDTLKFSGTLALQIKAQGQLKMMMVECQNNEQMRGIAKYQDDFDGSERLIESGHLAITIQPDKGDRYQGVVAIGGQDASIAQALEAYFLQSEQIATRIWLFANEACCAGLLLQAMPTSSDVSSLQIKDHESWQRIVHLTETLSESEALALPCTQLLHRLYHEENMSVYQPSERIFSCSCSLQRSKSALVALGKREAIALIEEQKCIIIDCQFCHQVYHFDEAEVRALFKEAASTH